MCIQVAAEKAAWGASKREGFELVTICPTFVLGPVISARTDATSILDVKVGLNAGSTNNLLSVCPPVPACLPVYTSVRVSVCQLASCLYKKHELHQDDLKEGLLLVGELSWFERKVLSCEYVQLCCHLYCHTSSTTVNLAKRALD